MQAKRLYSRAKGYTLVEILVVLTLFGLIASMIAPSLFSTSQRAQQEKFVAELIDLDTRARLLSGKHNACIIRFEAEQNQFHLVVVDHETIVLQTVQVPEIATAGFVQEHQSIEFDRFGRTLNYEYQISFDKLPLKIRFNGLSGWHEIMKGGIQ